MSENTTDEASTPWHSNRLLVIVTIFFAVVSMAVVGISVATHFAWQASPEKAMIDAIDYSAETPATYDIVTKDINATVSYDGKRQAITGRYKAVEFNAVVDGNRLYVKSSTPAELVKLFTADDLPENFRPMVDAIVARITDKWVSTSLERLPASNASESRNISCMLAAKSQFITNKDAKKELAKLYESNRFLVMEKAAVTDKSNAYKVTIQDEEFDGFVIALKKGQLYKSLRSDCENFVQTMVGMKNKDGDFSADILLSKSKNAFQKITARSVNSGSTTIDVRYGDVGTITIPGDSISYDSLSTGVIQSMVESYITNNR